MAPPAGIDVLSLAKALAGGDQAVAWPGDLPEPARELVLAVARVYGERMTELQKKEARAQENIVDLRVMLEGYARVKRELRSENEQLKSVVDPGRQPVIGADGGLRDVMRLVEKIRDTPIPVLITGETGTGKEVIARHIHAHGPREDGPFIAINCAALPEALLESELFGIEKAVATGVGQRKGKLEEASGGTLFLDEIGDMPLAMQAKILRALQEKEVVRLGTSQPIKLDVRVVSATNKDLRARIAAKEFREDLYYRLVGVHIHLPPLRERPQDIDRLLEHFVAETARRFGRSVRGLTPEAREALIRYPWPGNVRELIAEIQRSVAIADGDLVTAMDLTPRVAASSGSAGADGEGGAAAGGDDQALESLREARRRFERGYVQRVLNRTHGAKGKAAKILGLTPEGLRRKIRSLEMGPGGDDASGGDDEEEAED